MDKILAALLGRNLPVGSGGLAMIDPNRFAMDYYRSAGMEGLKDQSHAPAGSDPTLWEKQRRQMMQAQAIEDYLRQIGMK